MQAILDLRLQDAQFMIEEEKKIRPDNGYTIYLEHYAESIELIITEEQALYERLLNQYPERIKRMNELDDGSPDNGWLQAEMLFQTGLAQVKFGSRINGVRKMLSSYHKIRSHRKKNPGFIQNQKLTGTFNIILDNIPPFVRWAADLFGYSGNSSLGMYQLRHYHEQVKTTPGLAEEAALFCMLGYKLTMQDDDGFMFIGELDQSMRSNTLVKYLHANAAIYIYRNDLAIRLLGEIYQKDLQVDFHSLDYLTGRCKLNHLEKDADRYLKRFLSTYQGLDYKKDACNRLSYHYLIQGDRKKYEEYRAKVSAVGQTLRDRDQEALLEVTTGIDHHPGLLSARLFCDGGYFDAALLIIEGIDPENLDHVAYRLEYDYRLGRIKQLTHHQAEAATALTKAYDEGRSQPYTFATRAALQLARISEENEDYVMALEWYNRSINAWSSVHSTESLKDMAVKGAKRTKGKS
ncbi:MAG: hypothetical protein R6W71_09190 [Bacteroidales bacterium]